MSLNPTDNVYIPQFNPKPQPISIEWVREHGKIVYLSDDEKYATVQVTCPDGMTITYCAVILDENGKILDFIPRKDVGKSVTIIPIKEETPPTV